MLHYKECFSILIYNNLLLLPAMIRVFIIYLFINFIIIIIKNKIRYTTEYLHNKKLFNLKLDEQRIDSLEK